MIQDSKNNDIHVYLYQPLTNPIGIVQIVHGASEHFARYGLFAQFLANHGFIVIGNDILGHGLSTSNLNYVHFDDKIGSSLAYESLVLVKQWMEKNYGHIPHYIIGHSMGSFLARNMVLDFPKSYEKAVFSGSAAPPLMLLRFGKFLTQLIGLFKGQKHVSKLIQNMAIDANPNRMMKDKIIDTNEAWLTRDKAIQDYYKHSPMCGQPFTVSANRDMFDWIIKSNQKKRIKRGNHYLPMIFLSGDHDPLSDYGNQIVTLINQLKKFGYQDVQYKLYNEARHEILNELNKDEVYMDILNFLKSNK